MRERLPILASKLPPLSKTSFDCRVVVGCLPIGDAHYGLVMVNRRRSDVSIQRHIAYSQDAIANVGFREGRSKDRISAISPQPSVPVICQPSTRKSESKSLVEWLAELLARPTRKAEFLVAIIIRMIKPSTN